MLSPTVKYILKVIFVFIVIAGLLASYIFTGVSTQPQPEAVQPEQETFNFTGPTGEPAVNGPSGAPSAGGPATPPPGNNS